MPTPGLYTVQASSEAWPNSGSQAERGLTEGWLLDVVLNSTGGEVANVSPSTATAFLSSGNGTTGGTGFYAVARRCRVAHAGGTSYGEVTAASFAAGETTVTFGEITSGATALSTTTISSAAVSAGYTGTDGPLYLRIDELQRIQLIVKTSAESVTSSTVLQNDDALTVPAGSNQRWAFDMFLYGQPSSSATNFVCDWTGPAGYAAFWTGQVVPNAASPTTSHDHFGTNDITTDFSFTVSTSTYFFLRGSGVFITGGTSGNFQFRWAQNTSSTGALTIQSASWISAYRIT